MKYQVWTCKIVVPKEAELPDGFDSPPRFAAQNAIEKHGIEILSCFSGWGGRLTSSEKTVVKIYNQSRNSIY